MNPTGGARAWEPVSLSDLVARSVDHERLPVEVDPRLRIGAWVGLGLLVVAFVSRWWALQSHPGSEEASPSVLLARSAVSAFYPPGVMGAALVAAVGAATAAAAGVAWQTRAFRRASRLGHYAVFGVFTTGLVASFPLLVMIAVIALNIVAVIAVVCLTVVAVIVLVCLVAWST